MTPASFCILWLAFAGVTPAAEGKSLYKVGEITIELEPIVQSQWDFSDFRFKNGSEPTVECIAVRRGKVSLNRWYGYNSAGVKIAEGPLGYQDYLLGEKTLIEMELGNRARQITRIKIAAR